MPKDLVELFEETPGLDVRVQLKDERTIEGSLRGLGAADLMVQDAKTRQTLVVSAKEVRTVEAVVPRRVLEWTVAIAAIPAAAAVLVAFSWIPGVRPERGDITIGFLALFLMVMGLLSIPGVGRRLRFLLGRWQVVYPTKD